MLGATALALAAALTLVVVITTASFAAAPSIVLILGGAALVPAAAASAVLEPWVPSALRGDEPARTRPSRRVTLVLLGSWPVVTWALFWCLTGLTMDTDCTVDGSCSLGVPWEFASFGTRSGGSSMRWLDLGRDLGLLATLGPAAWYVATKRSRWIFAAYLLGIVVWIGIEAAARWSGMFGVSMWHDVSLSSLGGG